MRRRLAALFILSSAAAGCSLLVDFERDKIPGLADLEDAAGDATVPDARLDGPSVDGTVDALIDSTVPDGTVTVDAGDAGDAADARDAADAADARDAADASDAADARDARDANDANTVDANDANTADDGSSTADADDGSTTADADDGASTVDANDGATTADANTSTKCTTFIDLTGQSAVAITFPTTAAAAQYNPNCIRITAGTTVTFSGNFNLHPLTRVPATQTTSPIPVVTLVEVDGGPVGDVPITFPNPGTFDYECGVHPGSMFGGVEIVP